MKTPTLLFSLPLLIASLACQAAGQTTTATMEKQEANNRAPSDCCPTRERSSILESPSITPVVREESSTAVETIHAYIRGQKRPVEIMSGQVYLRSKRSLGRVHRFNGTGGMAEASLEARRLETAEKGTRADLIAYRPGQPRTEDNMFLLTSKVTVYLREGVDGRTFYASTGAVKAKLLGFAPNAVILYYPSAVDALEAVERLRAMEGVSSAQQIIAVKRVPEALPNEQYYRPSGPEYSPFPQTDNITHHSCPSSLCDIRGTSAYAWWSNNRAGLLGPINSVAAQVGLGDFPPIGYDPAVPLVQGEQADIRLPLAWENKINAVQPVSGFGQGILVIDDGIVKAHPDLAAAPGAAPAVDPLATTHKNMYTGANSPDPADPATDPHGTGLAGILAARQHSTQTISGIGIVGVAPRATLHSVVGIQRLIDDDEWAEAFAYGSTVEDSDLDGNLWEEERKGSMRDNIVLNASSEQGSQAATRLFPEDLLWHRAISFGAVEQRGYKGVIYVTSAGNGAGSAGAGNMDVNYSEQKNSIYQIPVGGVSELGRRIGRSNPGSPLVCVAPTWGDELPPLFRWSSAPAGWPSYLPIRKDPPVGPGDMPAAWRRATQGIVTLGSSGYNFDFTGTSASAAQVAGIVALMLEVNPSLNYRDVKEILLRSCRMVNDVRINTNNQLWPTQWRMSRTGRPMHIAFGAGLIDADRAIKIARDWSSLGLEPREIWKDGLGKPDFERNINDDDRITGGFYSRNAISGLIPTNGTWKEFPLASPPANVRLEHIEVRVRLYHYRRGDLEIKLVAPQEENWDTNLAQPMESPLFTPHRDDYTTSYYDKLGSSSNTPTDWTFTTVRHWGTVHKTGQWKLLVRDAIQLGTAQPPPLYVPKADRDANDPGFITRQRIEGIGVTWHYSPAAGPQNNPPVVKTKKAPRQPRDTAPRFIQLQTDSLGGGTGGTAPFPVTSWDMYDSSEICPVQMTNPAKEPFEFFPPGRRLPGDTSTAPVLVPLTTITNTEPYDPFAEWPQRQHPPFWMPFLPAPTEGASGALSSRPPWVTAARLTPNGNHIVFSNTKNPSTNVIHARINRQTGLLEVIPLNEGVYIVTVFAENLLGLSRPQQVEITVGDPDYESWANLFWNPPELGDRCTSPISGYFADPDGDGLQNALEYTMRLDPTIKDDGPLPAWSVEGNEVVFRWQNDVTTVADMRQIAEVSEDMQEWIRVEPTEVGRVDDMRDYEFRIPLGGDQRTFFRLKAVPQRPCP